MTAGTPVALFAFVVVPAVPLHLAGMEQLGHGLVVEAVHGSVHLRAEPAAVAVAHRLLVNSEPQSDAMVPQVDLAVASAVRRTSRLKRLIFDLRLFISQNHMTNRQYVLD
ncbi:unnamed protein product [Strongylus vulgaris]|uniref:Secreted protein n=1 Tax=Strongylus vulgaris TaxID=40348 RepID=A0A3P7J676_STRVU|nr:unnamed protein product [Strongylus vulgaris]